MKRVVALTLAACAALLLPGCGGGGGGGDSVDPNTSMIGTWQPITATHDGTTVKAYVVMPETTPVATRWEMEFRQNATCAFRAYNASGGLIETFNGTWTSDNGVATVKIAGSTSTIHWSDTGNVMTASYSIEGHAVVAKWARVLPTPADHEAQYVGTWVAQSVAINDNPIAVRLFFGWAAGSDSSRLVIDADGTATGQEMAGDTVVESSAGTWDTHDQVMRWTEGGVAYLGYVDGALLTFVMLDPQTGDAIRIAWQKLP